MCRNLTNSTLRFNQTDLKFGLYSLRTSVIKSYQNLLFWFNSVVVVWRPFLVICHETKKCLELQCTLYDTHQTLHLCWEYQLEPKNILKSEHHLLASGNYMFYIFMYFSLQVDQIDLKFEEICPNTLMMIGYCSCPHTSNVKLWQCAEMACPATRKDVVVTSLLIWSVPNLH